MFAVRSLLLNAGVIVRIILSVLNCSLLSSASAMSIFDPNRTETLESNENLWSKTIEDPLQNLTFRFTCWNKSPGFYADVDYDCRIFHVCTNDGYEIPALCPYNTKFDQRQGLCSDEKFNCRISNRWYFLTPSNYYMYFMEDVVMEDDEDEDLKFEPLPSY